jgi:hypothetical protein
VKKSKIIAISGIAAIAATASLTACGATKTVAVPGPTITKTVKVPGPPVKIITKTLTKTVTVKVPGPTITHTVIKDVPTPAPTEGTLLNFSGNGTEETPSFTAGGSGDYTVSWTYSGNTSDGIASNFIVGEDGGNDINAASLPNDIAASGSGNTGVFGDAGRHTFNVQSDGSWTIKVVSAP